MTLTIIFAFIGATLLIASVVSAVKKHQKFYALSRLMLLVGFLCFVLMVVVGRTIISVSNTSGYYNPSSGTANHIALLSVEAWALAGLVFTLMGLVTGCYPIFLEKIRPMHQASGGANSLCSNKEVWPPSPKAPDETSNSVNRLSQ